MKFYGVAANGLATGAFQKCNWGQIYPMIYRGLNTTSFSDTGVEATSLYVSDRDLYSIVGLRCLISNAYIIPASVLLPKESCHSSF